MPPLGCSCSPSYQPGRTPNVLPACSAVVAVVLPAEMAHCSLMPHALPKMVARGCCCLRHDIASSVTVFCVLESVCKHRGYIVACMHGTGPILL
jgi:hypothetical protein